MLICTAKLVAWCRGRTASVLVSNPCGASKRIGDVRLPRVNNSTTHFQLVQRIITWSNVRFIIFVVGSLVQMCLDGLSLHDTLLVSFASPVRMADALIQCSGMMHTQDQRAACKDSERGDRTSSSKIVTSQLISLWQGNRTDANSDMIDHRASVDMSGQELQSYTRSQLPVCTCNRVDIFCSSIVRKLRPLT